MLATPCFRYIFFQTVFIKLLLSQTLCNGYTYSLFSWMYRGSTYLIFHIHEPYSGQRPKCEKFAQNLLLKKTIYS